MGLYSGPNIPQSIYYGKTKINNVYKGSTKIYPEYTKFNAFQTPSSEWIFSGKGTLSHAYDSIYIACPAEYAAGTRGTYEYKKAINVSNKQTISFNASFANDRYMNLMVHLYYKFENTSSWTLLKTFDGSVNGKTIIYNATFPVSGSVNIMLAYGVSGYNCPVNINITKFTIE